MHMELLGVCLGRRSNRRVYFFLTISANHPSSVPVQKPEKLPRRYSYFLDVLVHRRASGSIAHLFLGQVVVPMEQDPPLPLLPFSSAGSVWYTMTENIDGVPL